MPWPRRLSTTTKKTAVNRTMMNTITEVIQVSWRLVQLILRASARTSLADATGLKPRLGASGVAALAATAGGLPAGPLGAEAGGRPAPRRGEIKPEFLAIDAYATFSDDRSPRRRRAPHRLYSGRSGGTRTPGPRFWRPMLYQLSYTPTGLPRRGFLRPAANAPESTRPPAP